MTRTARFLVELAARGQLHFTTAEAKAALGVSVTAVRAVLRRLEAKGDVAAPHRGFYVLVPPEYRRLGCLPPEQFVPQLMQHLAEPYYVTLLTAAELNGAAHQRPQTFQVMVPKNRRALECGKVRVQFLTRRNLEHTPVVERNTPRGPIRVASPEATALELVGYADRCGGLDHTATVLDDLVAAIDADKLTLEARRSPIAWTQRLGWLLDLLGHHALADHLAPVVHDHARCEAPLVRSRSRAGAKHIVRWKLAVNAHVEPEL
jgi:predicted transcriptional regulator of viral defense system